MIQSNLPSASAGAVASSRHVIAEISWQESSYFRCRKCKEWSMNHSYFTSDVAPSCIPDEQTLIATERETQHIQNIAAFYKQENTDNTTTHLLCCPGCYIKKGTEKTTSKKFQTLDELASHCKLCERYNINKKYKCNSCHFASNNRKDIEIHQKNITEK